MLRLEEARYGLREYKDRKLGYFCCGSCNALYQKTLKLADPELHSETEEAFMDDLLRKRTTRGRWKNCPFYYTVFSLDEMNTEATQEELVNAAERVNRSVLKCYQGNDGASRFRRLAGEAALSSR